MSSVPVDVGSIGTLFCQVNNFFRFFVDLFVRLPKSSISVGALTHLGGVCEKCEMAGFVVFMAILTYFCEWFHR